MTTSLPSDTAIILPPCIDHATFQHILHDLIDIVSVAIVSALGALGLLKASWAETYGDAYLLQPEKGREASAAIRPAQVSNVQAIVQLANKYKFRFGPFLGAKIWGKLP